jgi:hypothetical protein
MQITIIDDNGQKFEKSLSKGRNGIGPEEAIKATLQMFASIYTPDHVEYVLRKRIIPQILQYIL